MGVRRWLWVFSVVLVMLGCDEERPERDSGRDAGNLDAGPALDAGDGHGELRWAPCGDDRGECALLDVPVDHDDPSAGTIRLPIFRWPAIADRIGVLLVAPGSGSSGSLAAAQWPSRGWIPEMGEVVRRFDIVGLDLRGNPMSDPLMHCYDTPEQRDAFAQMLAEAPDDSAQEALVEGLIELCSDATGVPIEYFATVHRVRDMELLREVLGEDQLSLIGESYGTWTETVYAVTYPERVRAALMISALAVTDPIERVESHARGASAALGGFFTWCDADRTCAFRPTAGTARARFVTLMDELEARPLTSSRGMLDHRGLGSVVSALWFSGSVIPPRGYNDLANALVSAEAGDPDGILSMRPRAGAGAERDAIEQLLDLTPSSSTTYDMWRSRLVALQAELPIVGRWQSASDLRVLGPLAFPDDRRPPPFQLTAIPSTPPFLLLAGDYDPITPIDGAVALATALGNDSVVLDTNAVGHNAFREPIPCARSRAQAYLLDPDSLRGAPVRQECPTRSPDETVVGMVSGRFEWTGAADARLAETALGDLVADAMRSEASTQLAMLNGGGIRRSLPSDQVLPADASLRRPEPGYAAGPPYDVVVDDVLSVFPFGNRISTVTVTGAQLHALVEHALSARLLQVSGFSLTWDPAAAEGSQLRSLVLAGGDAIADEDSTTYTLAIPDYVYYGGTGYLGLIELEPVVGRSMDAALVSYLIANSRDASVTLDPVVGTRITPL